MSPENKKWAEQQLKKARRSARTAAGQGWGLLGPSLRNALVAAKVLEIIAAGDHEKDSRVYLAVLSINCEEDECVQSKRSSD